MYYLLSYIYIYCHIYISTFMFLAQQSYQPNELQRSLLSTLFAKDYTRIDATYIYNIDRWIYR